MYMNVFLVADSSAPMKQVFAAHRITTHSAMLVSKTSLYILQIFLNLTRKRKTRLICMTAGPLPGTLRAVFWLAFILCRWINKSEEVCLGVGRLQLAMLPVVQTDFVRY